MDKRKNEIIKKLAYLGRLALLPFLYVLIFYHFILTRMHMRIVNKAILREKEGRMDEAEAGYRLFLKKNKDATPVYFFLGNLYWRSNRRDKALKIYEKGKNTCPS
ncbi:MAG: tetratricopeptide repeat protein [Desulfobacteraceae bacterium]|nr:tetratricopeptide repeat protein [Desulfobacteraceae bacterium]